MPYRNFPKSIPQDKIDSCVKKVMASGKSKPSAIAICYTSLVKGKELDAALKSFELKPAPNYRKAKGITDAPNLRGADAQKCMSCKYFQPIVWEQEDGEASVEALCNQYDFEVESDWVCDSYEMPEPMTAKESELAVIKQADGRYRWVAFTSSSYLDRDGEIVSQSALETDADLMNKTKEYGTLDWWHTPIQLGTCDFSEMHGRISIESGTFDDNWIGEQLASHTKEFGASRAFYHPADEPDAHGVYHKIKTYARAILPRDKASNLLTSVYVGKEATQMIADKIKALVEKLGGDKQAEEKVNALLDVAAQTDKAAEQAGLAFKEAPPEPTPPEKPAEEIKDQPGMFVADMTPEEFDSHVAKAATAILAPIVQEVGNMVKALGEAQTAALKESGASITAQFTQITEKQSALDKRLAELEGLTPRRFRASQDGEVIDEKAKKELAPHGDTVAENSFEAFIKRNLPVVK